jgi:hypothetical protein
MKVFSAVLLTLLCYVSISCKKIKTSTKNFHLTCRNYGLADSKIFTAECQKRDKSWQSTSIDLTKIPEIYKNGELSNMCIPRNLRTAEFVVEYFCNVKGREGAIKKYTAELTLTDLLKNENGVLYIAYDFSGHYLRNKTVVSEGPNLFEVQNDEHNDEDDQEDE